MSAAQDRLEDIRERNGQTKEPMPGLRLSSVTPEDVTFLLDMVTTLHEALHRKAEAAGGLAIDLERERIRSAQIFDQRRDAEADAERLRTELERIQADRDRLQGILNAAVGWTEPAPDPEGKPVRIAAAISANFESILSLSRERTAAKEDLAEVKTALRDAVLAWAWESNRGGEGIHPENRPLFERAKRLAADSPLEISAGEEEEET